MVQETNETLTAVEPPTGLEIAVIGLSGRFPGAKNIDEFWENIKNGVESISFFTVQELNEAGVEPHITGNPNCVKANSILEDIDYFDAGFFGYTPREADVMDPQMRIFHECAWNALEDAGYCPDTYGGLIGVYAGAAASPGWEFYVHFSGKADEIGKFAALQLADKDFLCTTVSYRFNLKGPAVIVHTACSTSLVSIHMACQAILNGECDLALAGGVNITTLEKTGYIYQEGMISSPDGHCRAFDARARGTIQADGVGIVVLKRLEKAMPEGDFIYALVKGSAINNDGLRKVGFTAPSIEGQAEVIITAQEMAEVEPESITYVETHGTATELGDPVEIEALKLAFNTNKKSYCAIGSVKTNMGHLNAAAGVTGFIKALLAIYHRQIPPGLHFEAPNAKIDFDNSPFYVNTSLKQWENPDFPLRAGINSFGIGGTNAHVILEEAPKGTGKYSEYTRKYQLILLSAKTREVLEQYTRNLADHLDKNIKNIEQGLNLADVAYTLQVGRKAFKYRQMLVCTDVEEAVEILSSPDSGQLYSHMKKDEQQEPAVIFMFPGQGAQYVNMGLELYQSEPVFREELDRCFEILKSLTDNDLKEIIYPGAISNKNKEGSKVSGEVFNIDQTEIAQPLIFIIEYALARLLMKWGIKPFAMIGHSIGEYVAACLSGVFSLENALEIVVLRGRMMQQLPPGAMLSIPMAEAELIPLLKSHDEISLAAVNSTSYCVVSGPHDAIDTLARQLKELGHENRPLHTSHAFHSRMMEPMLDEFEEKIGRLTLEEKADIPYISNITGTWASVTEAASPRYWARHIRNTVRFGDGVTTLLQSEPAIFVEVGPGRSLSTFVRQHQDKKTAHKTVDIIRHPGEEVSDSFYLLKQVGHIWVYGHSIDWQGFHGEEKHRRIPLPVYPFKGERYQLQGLLDRINKGSSAAVHLSPPAGKKTDLAQWFYIPTWKLSPLRGCLEYRRQDTPLEQKGKYLVLANDEALTVQLVERLKQSGGEITIVKPGPTFVSPSKDKGNNGFVINPHQDSDYRLLFEKLESAGQVPRKIIHCWNVTGHENSEKKAVDHNTFPMDKALEPEIFEQAQDPGYYSLLYLAQTIGKQRIQANDKSIEIIVLSDRMQAVTGEERLEPVKALIRGALQVIPREYPGIACRSIDIDYPLPTAACHSPNRENITEQLLESIQTEIQMNTDSPDLYVAFRNNLRWTQTYEQMPLAMKDTGVPILREKGVYLVTGGIGGIGLELATYLAKTVKARLILVGRSPFPERQQWNHWLDTHDEEDKTAGKIRKIREMEAAGAEVLISCTDAADFQQVQHAAARAEAQFGPINGIIHSAGLADGGLIPNRTREMSEKVFAPKVRGTLVLDALFCKGKNRDKLDFMVLCSSLSSVLSAVGQVAYCAANAFLDSFAYANAATHDTYTVSVNWDSWQEVGMAVKAEEQLMARQNREDQKESRQKYWSNILKDGILPAEGVEIFRRVLAKGKWPQVLISTTDMLKRIRESRASSAVIFTDRLLEESSSIPRHPRPELSTPYVPPITEIQQVLARIWQQFLGIEPIGIHDDFFELGGDSLKVMTVSAKIHKELNVEIPLKEFFNSPNIKILSQYIEKTGKQAYSPIVPAETKEYYPLSPAQERLYILHRMEENFTGYNETFAAVMEGRLDKERFNRAVSRLIKIHESLRTSFETINDRPVQRIHSQVEFSTTFDRINVTSGQENMPDTGLPASLTQFLRDFIRPFDLSCAPLLRIGLIEIGEEKHILVYDIHHIITDGTSMRLLIRDLLALYGEDEFPCLYIRYRDFSQWQNRLLEDSSIKKQEEYWLKQFPGEIPVLELPTDFSRPSMQSFAGHSLCFEVGKDDTSMLRKLALEENITLYMVLLALYTIFLAKISGQEDIVIGVPVAGRPHADLEPVMGMFVNTLPIRNYPIGEKTFMDFLGEIKKHTLEALENQQYQVEDLVEQLSEHITRDTSRNPLFDVMFVFQNIALKLSDSNIPGKDGLKLTNLDFENRPAKFDLSLYGNETGDTLFLHFVYCTKLFKKETVLQWIRYFMKMLSLIIEAPETKISGMEIISEAEKKQLLMDFNDTAASYPHDKTIHDLFSEQLQRTPDNIAVVGTHSLSGLDEEETGEPAPGSVPVSTAHITYSQLNREADGLAHRLIEKGVRPDTIVAVMVKKSIEMIIGILGILKAGGAYMPIEPDYPEKRRQYMLADSSARVLVTTRTLAKEVKKLRSLEVKKNLEIIFIDSTEFSVFSSSQLLNFSTSPSPGLAYVIYTSGTSGRPKGVPTTHGCVVRLMTNNKFRFDFNKHDVWSLFHSYCFDFSVWEMYGALLYGGELVIIPKTVSRDTEEFLKLLKIRQVSILNQTPSAFYQLTDQEAKITGRELNVRYVIFGGEALAPKRLARWKQKYPGTKLINMYGITETTVHVTFKEIGDDEIEAGISNIGGPIPTLYAYVTDKYQNLQPIGIAGELCVGGEGLARGYINQPEITAEKFEQIINKKFLRGSRGRVLQKEPPGRRRQTIYKSGDLVRWLTNGELEYRGRIDQQVKIRGFRIEPGEIESRLTGHEAITGAVVTVNQDKTGDKFLCAYFVATRSIPVPQLKEHLAKALPGYMIPAYFVPMERIPLTPNKKVNRKALPAPQVNTASEYTAPRNEIEEKLVEIWTEVLVGETSAEPVKALKIGLDDNFFELGGHSLRAAVIAAKIHKAFNIKIPLGEIFRAPTIRGLSAAIKKARQDRFASICPAEKKEYYILSSSQERLYMLQQMNTAAVIYNMPVVFLLQGKIILQKMEQIFAELIDRHESFRTCFIVIGADVFQEIRETVDFALEYPGAASLEEDPAPGTANHTAAIKNFIRPFDLGNAPLLRVGLIKISPQEHIFMMDMHHIISDGTSQSILVNELMALYRGKELPGLRIQYRDHSQWQYNTGFRQMLNRQETYWLSEFANGVPMSNLPTDFDRPETLRFAGNIHKFELDDNESSALKKITAEEEVSLFGLVLALLNVLVAKITGREDLVIGTQVAGRQHADLQNIIGVFLNTVALRNKPEKHLTFTGFLHRVMEKSLQAFENQDYPFEELVKNVVGKRAVNRNPLFDVMLVWQNFEQEEIRIPGLSLKPYPHEHETRALIDLSLYGREKHGKLVFYFEYSTELFKKESIQRFVEYLKDIIAMVIAHKEIKLKDINISHRLGMAGSEVFRDKDQDFGF